MDLWPIQINFEAALKAALLSNERREKREERREKRAERREKRE
jgi:hypothetical protein